MNELALVLHQLPPMLEHLTTLRIALVGNLFDHLVVLRRQSQDLSVEIATEFTTVQFSFARSDVNEKTTQATNVRADKANARCRRGDTLP